MKISKWLPFRRTRRHRCLVAWSGVAALAISVFAADEVVTIDFRNRIPGVLDAPVFDADGATPLGGNSLLAVLCGSTNGADSLSPLTPPRAALGTGDGAGYWDPDLVPLPGAVIGQEIWVQVRVGVASPGSGGGSFRVVAMSSAFKLTLTNSPMPLIGLDSFAIPHLFEVGTRDAELIVSWGYMAASSYAIEVATSLEAPTNWTQVFSAGPIGPFEYTETLAATNTARYFRLKWWR